MARGYGNSEAVVLQFGPLIQQEFQRAAQKRAENAYLDRQVATDMSKLKADGIRPQDVPVFLKQYNTVKDLAIRNRDAIRNPARNPQAYQEYQDAVGQLQATIAESKGAKEQNKMAYGFYSKNAGKIDQDQFRAAAADFNAPIGTPEFERGKNYDITQAVFKPAQFDQGKFQTFLNAAVKPVDRVDSQELPTGQRRNVKVRYTDPNAIQNVVGQAYDNDLQHAKKFFDDQFSKTDENQLAQLQEYAQKYIPNFEIRNGRDYAVAANMYGQVEKDMGETIAGSPWKANQAFQRDQQARSFAQQEKMWQKKVDKKDDGYYLVNDMAAALKSGDISKVVGPLQASASPGVQVINYKTGETPERYLDEINRVIKKNGIDGTTKLLSPEDFKQGVVVIAVPRINKDTKQPEKGQYDYMAISRRGAYSQIRLNQMLNYAKGGVTKPLPDKYYKQQFGSPGTKQATTTFAPGSLDEDDEDIDDESDEN